MGLALLFAGLMDLIWAMLCLICPTYVFEWGHLQPPTYLEFWTALAIITGVLGTGYIAASGSPVSRWVIVLVGFLGKLLLSVVYVTAVIDGRFTITFGGLLIAKDLVWIAPFGLILAEVYHRFIGREPIVSPDIQRLALSIRTNRGESLLAMSEEQPLLLVFLRYLGCPFCRESLADIARQRNTIESEGCQIVFVHMEPDQFTHDFLMKQGLSDIPRVHDISRSLYRAFGLQRGSLWRLIGPLVWARGISAAFLKRNGIGWFTADPFQLPGVFYLYHGEVLHGFRHRFSKDRPNYAGLASLELGDLPGLT